MSIKTKPAKINQKEPTSRILPKRETSDLRDASAERRKTNAIENPENISHDLGKIIRPSKNLAIAQKITHKARPTTKSNPFETSIGIFVNGKQKRGNNTTT